MIEAGLGGRFDATNVIPSKVQVLTSRGARAHALARADGSPTSPRRSWPWCATTATLVVGELDPASRGGGRARGAPSATPRWCRAPADVGVPLRAPGGFQRRNFALAAAAAEAFLGRALDAETRSPRPPPRPRIPAALEVVAERPLTVYDGAHNPAGARALAESLDEVLGDRRPRVAVIGVLEDKDAAGMLRELLPRFDRVVFTRSRNPRSLSPGDARRRWPRSSAARPRRRWPTRARRSRGRGRWRAAAAPCWPPARST